MALKKIKELIREMVFENQSNAHQYAEVMANLVFDRNKFDEYETKIDEAKQNTAEYDIKIKEINAELDKAKSDRNNIVSRKKELTVEKFKSAMADINQNIKALETEQRTTIDEKIKKGFVNLDPVIKKYACLRYLSNEYVKNADFKTETDEDGFIYADDYEFKSSEIARNFREISDYVDYIFGNRNSKITEPKSIVEIIKRDASELNLPIENLTPSTIIEIYNSLLARIAEENRNKQSEKEQIELSQIGIEPIQDFGDGLVMYRLLPDTEYYDEHHKHRNLVYEGNQMGICIGQEQQSYSQNIFDLKKNQYYSLRKKQPNGQLMPHCTIEVNSNTVSQVKGKSNGPVTGNYIQPVRDFLKQHLNVAFPGEENTKNKRELYDYSNIGFIEDFYYETVDLFNLPPNTELGKISYDLLSVKGIDLKNIKSIKTLECKGGTITQKELDKISNNFVIKTFRNAKLSGTFDFSNKEELVLNYCDLSNAEIKFNPNAKYIDIDQSQGLHGKYDFSGVTTLCLRTKNLSNAEIKFNPNAKYIGLNCPLQGIHDFSGVKELYCNCADLSNAEIKFNPNATFINLHKTSGLHGTHDFSSVKEINLSYCYLSNAEIKLNPNADYINLGNTKGLRGTYDFSGVKKLILNDCYLSNAEIKFNPNAKYIDLSYVKGLHGILDFNGVKELILNDCDLSKVTKIIVNQELFDNIIDFINESDRHKIVVAKPKSKVDLLNKGITNLKNKMSVGTQQPKEKMSGSGRNND